MSLEQENTVLYFFSYIMINEILPFEAKYISLRTKKDFKFVRDVIHFYLQNILLKQDKLLSLKSFEKDFYFLLEQKLINAKVEYITLLIQSNQKLFKSNRSQFERYFTENKKDIKLDTLDDFIEEVERLLDITNTKIKDEQVIIEKIDEHISSSIYKKELEIIKRKLKKFHNYFTKLEEILIEKNFLQKIDENKTIDKISNIEYLYFVVIHEFWNFLAHFSMSVVYFNSPKVYLSNLHKSISHLKRAIMDLLDGMIVEFGCSKKADYLKLRVAKISSLGNSTKIQNLIKDLEDVFNICLKEFKNTPKMG